MKDLKIFENQKKIFGRYLHADNADNADNPEPPLDYNSNYQHERLPMQDFKLW